MHVLQKKLLLLERHPRRFLFPRGYIYIFIIFSSGELPQQVGNSLPVNLTSGVFGVIIGVILYPVGGLLRILWNHHGEAFVLW